MVPEIAMRAYVGDPRVGALAYNCVHSCVDPFPTES
jgi:hypothetical protein